ncbi:hypothetical protein BGW38_008179, partial [Lunasporangiospora selenospora]
MHFFRGLLALVLLGVLDGQLVSVMAQLVSPPNPQPGPAVIPNPAPSPSVPNPANDAPKPNPVTTGNNGATTPPAGSIVTTVTVINGTTTTVTLTLTAAAPPAVQQPQTTSLIPKAPQSVLLIQSTTFGKVLPAAGPVDDQVESHFWDRFAPPSDGGIPKPKGSDAASLGSPFSVVQCLVIVTLSWLVLNHGR